MLLSRHRLNGGGAVYNLAGGGKGEFLLVCTHDKLGHITLDVHMHQAFGAPERWRISANVVVDAGQLVAIAREVKELFQACGANKCMQKRLRKPREARLPKRLMHNVAVISRRRIRCQELQYTLLVS